ncbi:hypothetical protein [Mycolicibacter arupensis]|uniref:Uncharacterized protein n=1 Tax=Mycolicibacter arupensis TaxID=342002 RepID=A0A5C7Y225_9MYCO|nr:hypothetical protein [Mycolicibacter arupensis]TXI55919.1 MAG: hypothetical protein E6Q54_11875 [Mycolicibacter arupensis]
MYDDDFDNDDLYANAPVRRPFYAATASGCTDEAIHKRLMLEWYGLTSVRGSAWYQWAYCPCRLSGKRCVRECMSWKLRPSIRGIWDHARAWRNADGDLVFTTEPWGNPFDTTDEFASLTAELDELGIVTSFEGRSPYGASYVLFAVNADTAAGKRMSRYRK